MKELCSTESVRSREQSRVVDKSEVTRDRVNDNATVEERPNEITSASKKRGRVKIKISRNNSRDKICNIIESNTDLIDKTPSPYLARDVIKGDEVPRDDTPKRTTSRKALKNRSIQEITNFVTPTGTDCENGNSGDENDNLVVENVCRKFATDVHSIDNDLTSEAAQMSSMEIAKSEREEHNAFQVLMTRKKPLQYKSIPSPTQQEKELVAKAAEDAKNKLKENKEKLIELANKKGYAKRKHNEIEESERIEARLEKRAKVFKQMATKKSKGKRNSDFSGDTSSGSLHNYFSKSTAEVTKCDSSPASIVVESEISVPNSTVTRTVNISADENEREVKDSLLKTDTIEMRENSDSSATDGESRSKSIKKRKWSLRINLRRNEDDAADPMVEDAENVERANKNSKSRRLKDKVASKDKRNSDLAGSSIKTSKKKKSSENVTAAKNSLATTDLSSDTRDPIPMEIPIVASPEISIIEEKMTTKVGKLAPLFRKREKLDPAVLEARRAFLQSVPAENHDRKNDRKAPSVASTFLPFPTISHVQQLEGESKSDDSSHQRIFPAREVQPFLPKFDLKEFRCVTSLNLKQTNNSIEGKTPVKSSIEEVLKEIESRCSDARKIWATISLKSTTRETTRQSPLGRGRKKKSVDKRDDTLMRGERSNENCAWTEKYRPTSTHDIVGNEEAAEKFSKWLSGWRENSEKNDGSSGDEFYSSDCSYADNNNQVAVLLGPHGSGKTASVYAIAEEMGYSVLEINASSKRTGKKILKDLEEATKSHRIKRQDFTQLKATTRDNVKTLPQNSLILVEDVDIVFQEDEGFIPAIWQLASNTKRPIVMTGTAACSHLNRMAPQQLRIYYQDAFGSRVFAFLELITFAESGYRLPRSCLDRLLQKGDLRKALLQLQYLLMSGKPNASAVPMGFHQSLWQDMRPCIYKPAIRGAKKSKKKRTRVEKSLPCEEKSVIDKLAKDLDKLSFLSTMIEIDDPAVEISSTKLEPSVSLDENINDYSSTRETSCEIAKWLRDRLMKDVVGNDYACNDLNHFRQLCMKKELSVGVDLALSQVSSHTLDRRSTTLDYLSSVRSICRAEEARTLTNNKRGNRFFHYLQNLRLPAISTKPNILAAACKMMRENDAERNC